MANQVLANKVAFVTGIGSGIGRAAAILFAKEGATVVGVDLNESTALETLSEIETAGGKGIVVKADLTKHDEVKTSINTALERSYR